MENHKIYSNVVESEVHNSCDVKNVSSYKIFVQDYDKAHYTLRSTGIELSIFLAGLSCEDF